MPNLCVCTDGVAVGDDADRGEFRKPLRGISATTSAALLVIRQSSRDAGVIALDHLEVVVRPGL
jgi:hypothetical protein